MCTALRDSRAYKMHTPRRELVHAHTQRKCVVLHVALECASINSRCCDDDGDENDDYNRDRDGRRRQRGYRFFRLLSPQPTGVCDVPVVVLLYASSSCRDDVAAASRCCRLARGAFEQRTREHAHTIALLKCRLRLYKLEPCTVVPGTVSDGTRGNCTKHSTLCVIACARVCEFAR